MSSIEPTSIEWKCRWIDERKGILEVSRNGKVLYRFSFLTNDVKDLCRSFYSTDPVDRKFIVQDGLFHFVDDLGEVGLWIFGEADNHHVMPYYERWLNRVMLADDISKSRAEERSDSPQTGMAGSKQGSRRARSNPQSAGADGNDSNIGGVPPSKGKGLFPVGSREHTWRIRPKGSS